MEIQQPQHPPPPQLPQHSPPPQPPKLSDEIINLVVEFSANLPDDESEKAIRLVTKFENNVEQLINLYKGVINVFNTILPELSKNNINNESLLNYLISKLKDVEELMDKQEDIFTDLRIFITKIGRYHPFLRFLDFEITTFVKYEIKFGLVLERIYKAIFNNDINAVELIKKELIALTKEYQERIKTAVNLTLDDFNSVIILLGSSITVESLKPHFERIIVRSQEVINREAIS